jgi:hypothetical protein
LKKSSATVEFVDNLQTAIPEEIPTVSRLNLETIVDLPEQIPHERLSEQQNGLQLGA